MMHDTRQMQQLWIRVILQAVRDALGSGPIKDADGQLLRHRAREWLEGGTRDFHEVCDLAGFSGDVVSQWWLSIKDSPEAFNSAARFLREASTGRKDRGEQF